MPRLPSSIGSRTSRARFLRRLGVASGALLLAACAREATGSVAPRPNVVVLVADDLGWRDLFPHVPTPNLERLARSGLVLRSAYAMPVCTPSRYCALFGRYPRRDGFGGGALTIPKGGAPVPSPELLSLPEMFLELGYSTAAFGKWHVEAQSTPVSELARRHGFQVFRAGTPGNLGRGDGYHDWERIDDGVVSATHEYATSAVRRAFVDWWRATPGPRFAWVAFHAPHQPFHVPPAELLPAGTPAPQTTRARYEAAVMALDHELGAVLAELDLQRDLVIFLGDNGTPPLAAAPDQDATHLKSSTFEGGVHVPLFIAGPGIRPGSESSELVHVVDLFATLAERERFTLPPDAAVDSRSFAPLLLDPTRRGPRESVFLEVYGSDPDEGPGDELAVRTRTHKLRRAVVGGRVLEQLFDLEHDPREEHPLDPDDSACAALAEQLRAMLAKLPPRKGA